MPKDSNVSVVTCLHAPGNAFIKETHESLKAQTLKDFEWVILTNNGGRVPKSVATDHRVKIFKATPTLQGVGALKAKANALAAGRYLIELDADDLLAPKALERTYRTFTAGADFVYSDFAEFKDDGKQWIPHWEDYPYGEAFGWRTYPHPVLFHERPLIAMHAPEMTAHNIRRVEWAPNHLRAWRRDIYERIGGHDVSMAVADDHDLIVRLFLAGAKTTHIAECLYFYRVHGKNTVADRNAEIQAATERVYNKNIWALAEKWATDEDLAKVDLCGRIDAPAGYVRLDRTPGDGVTICDLDETWPLEDSSVGVLRAHDALEHLEDPIHIMNEAFRVLAPGGFFMISIPSDSITIDVNGTPVTMAGRGAWCDPTHKRAWNKRSFYYYTNKNTARYVPDFEGRFQTSRLIEWYPSEWHKQEGLPYVEAHLFCAKDGFRAMGAWGW